MAESNSTPAGKRGMTGKHGRHRRGPKVARVAVVCEACGKERQYLPSEIRVRGVVRFCSNQCKGRGQLRQKAVSCSQCGKSFSCAVGRNGRQFCSKPCVAASRRVACPKWPSKANNRPFDKDAVRDYMRAYVAANREHHNARARDWASRHRDKRNELQRARRADYVGVLLASDWLEIRKRYGFRCLGCGQAESLIRPLEVDHVVPVSRGGTNAVGNIQPLCRACNASKGAKTIDYRAAIHNIDIRETR